MTEDTVEDRDGWLVKIMHGGKATVKEDEVG